MEVQPLIGVVVLALLGISVVAGLLLGRSSSRVRIFRILPLLLVGMVAILLVLRSAREQRFETAAATERYAQAMQREKSIVTYAEAAEAVRGPVPSITVSTESAIAPSPSRSPAAKPNSPRTLKAIWKAFADAMRKAEPKRFHAGEAATARTAAKKSDVPSPKTQDPIPKPQDPRPDWIGKPAQPVDDCYQVSVCTTPYATPLDCEPELNREIERAVGEYVARLLDGEAASKIQLPMDYVSSHIVKSQYQEAVTTSVGPMVKLHALLLFDRETRLRIDQQWKDFLMLRRLRHAGGGLAGMLLLLSVAWGYLRTDLATAGAYRGRLQILATLAILTVLVASVALMGK